MRTDGLRGARRRHDRALADTFGVTIDAIVEASDLEDPDVLAIGDPLTIPCPSEAPEEAAEDGA